MTEYRPATWRDVARFALALVAGCALIVALAVLLYGLEWVLYKLAGGQ